MYECDLVYQNKYIFLDVLILYISWYVLLIEVYYYNYNYLNYMVLVSTFPLNFQIPFAVNLSICIIHLSWVTDISD